MNTTPKVSIVIPVYKAEPYIEDCVQSILQQTFEDFELLLVDDGSPDKSGELCDGLAQKDSRIRVFHKPNGGATSARKYGVEHATGEWIMFSDADDTIPIDAIEDLVGHIDAQTAIVAGTIFYQSLNITIKTKTDSSLLSSSEYICHLLSGTTYYGPCSKLIRRVLFEGVNWLTDSEVFQNEDLLMLCQICVQTEMNVKIANDIIHYTCISRDSSASSRKMKYEGWRILFNELENSLRINNHFSKEEKDAYVNYCIKSMGVFCVQNRIMVPHDKTVTRILDYAKDVKISNENLKHYSCLKSTIRIFLAVYVRRLKDKFVAIKVCKTITVKH